MSGQVGPPPAERVSDAEREQGVARLRDAAAEGRLTLEELAARIEAADAARTRAELERLTEDLPAATAPAGTQAAAPGRHEWHVAVMGGVERKGRWRVPARSTCVAAMGGIDLDLREATLESGTAEVRVFALMGGVDIVVPEGVRVEMGGFSFMGGRDLLVEGPAPPPDAPVVRVRAWAILGGVDVRTTRSGDIGPRRHWPPEPPSPPPPPAPPPTPPPVA